MAGIPVVAVVGPTATGKTRLAVGLSLRFGGEVVSADSMQIYRGLDIGTAKPTIEEMRGVPHHLIDFLDPSQSFSVADFVELASKSIADINARGKLPIVAGGTGLYIWSLLNGLNFLPQEKDEELRAKLKHMAEQEGTEKVWKMLREIDPESAERIHPNNVGRVIRAIEVYRVTGITMTEQIRRSREKPSPYDPLVIGLTYRDRSKLYDAINRRVDIMMQRGLLKEAETVFKMEHAATASQAIGYKEFFPYFRGECSVEESVEQVKRESRRYAKRQLTWFRRDESVQWLYVDEFANPDELLAKAASLILQKGWKR
ncbi:MAG: tRNA dimethylallyltransferase [Thermocaproicibacter melissae]|jgi:tRNA dimethylallyltransferase|uniref:tRNA (adenosine(37)-N6)-dimethylallyltransferase MiaA n=1 Tax=Thermocaproicibacter melissae TaxID=2966552 RepID=UPI0024B1689F|nr:tRNA (adenosine(37)-N6)-dimethylallyltransferase MiaA [Thermocaproicibacter melissae]WBY64973.1 tRNA (adenosine(37)-N6)-dimethylallyltransferase MiaA [Thermocaproicibacter melissae]